MRAKVLQHIWTHQGWQPTAAAAGARSAGRGWSYTIAAAATVKLMLPQRRAAAALAQQAAACRDKALAGCAAAALQRVPIVAAAAAIGMPVAVADCCLGTAWCPLCCCCLLNDNKVVKQCMERRPAKRRLQSCPSLCIMCARAGRQGLHKTYTWQQHDNNSKGFSSVGCHRAAYICMYTYMAGGLPQSKLA